MPATPMPASAARAAATRLRILRSGISRRHALAPALLLALALAGCDDSFSAAQARLADEAMVALTNGVITNQPRSHILVKTRALEKWAKKDHKGHVLAVMEGSYLHPTSPATVVACLYVTPRLESAFLGDPLRDPTPDMLDRLIKRCEASATR